MLPPALFMAAFFLLPLGRVLFTSFTGPNGTDNGPSLQAYHALFNDAVFPIVLIGTLRIALLVTLGAWSWPTPSPGP